MKYDLNHPLDAYSTVNFPNVKRKLVSSSIARICDKCLGAIEKDDFAVKAYIPNDANFKYYICIPCCDKMLEEKNDF